MNNLGQMELPAKYEGDSMTAKYNRMIAFDNIARDSANIELEAICRAADALERIADALAVPPANRR